MGTVTSTYFIERRKLVADLIYGDVLVGLVVTWSFFAAVLIGRYVRMKQLVYKKRKLRP